MEQCVVKRAALTVVDHAERRVDQGAHAGLVHRGDALQVEAEKGFVVVPPLVPDHAPAEAALLRAERQHLEERLVVAQRRPPDVVVVRAGARAARVRCPVAARHAVVGRRRLRRLLPLPRLLWHRRRVRSPLLLRPRGCPGLPTSLAPPDASRSRQEMISAAPLLSAERPVPDEPRGHTHAKRKKNGRTRSSEHPSPASTV